MSDCPIHKPLIDADLSQVEEHVLATLSCEEAICNEIMQRREHGLRKYGTSVDGNPLSLLQWLQHAKEEALDQAIYLERIKREVEKQMQAATTIG